MRTTFLILCILFFHKGISQEKTMFKRHSFTRLDLALPLRINHFYGSDEPHPDSDRALIIIDGAMLRIGPDIKMSPWIHVVGMVGFDWKSSYGLTGIPLFGAIKFCPQSNSEISLMIEPGFGKFFEISKNHQSGYFAKLSIGLAEVYRGNGFFLEFAQYGLGQNIYHKINNFSVGLMFNVNNKTKDFGNNNLKP